MLKRTKIRIALAVWLALIASLTWSDSWALPPPPHHNYYKQTNQHTNPVAYEQITTAFYSVSGWFGDRTDGQITAIATAAIAAFTIVIAWIGCRQFKDSRILQRAYLSVEPKGVFTLRDDPTNRLVAHVNILNSGHLPAVDVSWTINCEYSDDPGKKDLIVDESKVEGNNVVTPGGSMVQGSPPIARTEGAKYIYVFGIAIYNDGFAIRRRTRFCHRYAVSMLFNVVDKYGGTGGVIDPEIARYHRHGNKTD